MFENESNNHQILILTPYYQFIIDIYCFNVQCGTRILVPHWKKNYPDLGNFVEDLLTFLKRQNFQIFCRFFAYFCEFRFERKKGFFCSFWLIYCYLDPDPGSQNLADPTDPDPEQCLIEDFKKKIKRPPNLKIKLAGCIKNLKINKKKSTFPQNF